LEVLGKAAHSGANPTAGRSAIDELARKIVQLHALSDLAKGMTANVGKVVGGQSTNTVAPHAEAEFELRFETESQKRSMLVRVREIADTFLKDGLRSRLATIGETTPLEYNDENRKLLVHYQDASAEMGYSIEGIAVGGGADSGIVSSAGCPTICSVGPVGGKGHTHDEFVQIETIVPRAQMLALTVSRLSRMAT
jgi:glutamate carboxypeptidase